MIGSLFLVISVVFWSSSAQQLPDARPPYDKRSFHSKTIDYLIDTLSPLFKDSNMAILFANTLPNTLDTTVSYHTPTNDATTMQDLDSFVITGDIDALWLRDSMNQVLPYVPYVKQDTDLDKLVVGLINRHAKSVLLDPFANAFNFNASGQGHQNDIRTPPMTRSVFEGKYEIDSICAFMKLSYWYWQSAGTDGLNNIINDKWLTAIETSLDTIELMRQDDGRGANPPYKFLRATTAALDTLSLYGRGPSANSKTGLSRSLFRPSDDAVTLPYNIPGNAMACVEARHVADMLIAISELSLLDASKLSAVKQKARLLSTGLCSALRKYSLQRTIPYEVDGFKSFYYMDDANLPSLLSLPAIGYMAVDHESYLSTRSFVLSAENPFFFEGTVTNGVGGPHVGYNYSWPMAIAMRAMTSRDEAEIENCLKTLLSTTAGTGLMHESFNVNNANDYTRSWFAWANGLFGELILQLITTHPTLVLKDEASIAQAQAIVLPTVSLLSQLNTVLK